MRALQISLPILVAAVATGCTCVPDAPDVGRTIGEWTKGAYLFPPIPDSIPYRLFGQLSGQISSRRMVLDQGMSSYADASVNISADTMGVHAQIDAGTITIDSVILTKHVFDNGASYAGELTPASAFVGAWAEYVVPGNTALEVPGFTKDIYFPPVIEILSPAFDPVAGAFVIPQDQDFELRWTPAQQGADVIITIDYSSRGSISGPTNWSTRTMDDGSIRVPHEVLQDFDPTERSIRMEIISLWNDFFRVEGRWHMAVGSSRSVQLVELAR